MKRSDQVPAARGRGGWGSTLASNLPAPILIALLIPLGAWVESRSFGGYNTRIVMDIGPNVILAVSLQLINGFSGQFSLGHAGFMAVGAFLAAYPAREYARQFRDPFTTLLFFLSIAISVAIGAAMLGGLIYAIRQSRRLHRAAPPILLVALLAWIVMDFAAASSMTDVPARFVWTRGLGGLEHLFAATLASLAPAAGRLSAALPASLAEPLCFVILLIGGGCFAGAVGFVVGLPALRLRGDYLAIATLGMAQIILIAIQNSTPLGAALGLSPIPKYTNFAWMYGTVIVTIVVVWRVAYSPKGRAIMAVREDEIAAAAVGLNGTQYKVMAFVIGAFFAGIAGALYALYERSITPQTFNLQRSIDIVVMVTLGGLGSISGAILAAVVLTVLPELLRIIGTLLPPAVMSHLPDWFRYGLEHVADYRIVLYSVLLILIMLLRPQGLLGGRELWPRRRGHVRPPAPTLEGPVPA